jgi:hypothetical protein
MFGANGTPLNQAQMLNYSFVWNDFDVCHYHSISLSTVNKGIQVKEERFNSIHHGLYLGFKIKEPVI